MNIALVALWSIVMLTGVGLLLIGLRLRRTDQVREGVPGNAVAFIGVLLVVGGGVALRQEFAR